MNRLPRHLGQPPRPDETPAGALRAALETQRRIVTDQARLRPTGSAWYDHDTGRKARKAP